MKLTIKKIYSIISICLIFGISSCEKDEPYQNDSSSKSITYKTITLKELKSNPLAFDEFKKIETKIEEQKKSRLIYNSKYNFTIDTDKILYIQKGGYHSYTFPIYNDIDKGKTENLVFSLKKDNQYEAYLTKYTLTDLDKERIKKNEFVDLLSKTDVTNLQNQTSAQEPCYDLVSTPVAWNSQGQVIASLVSVIEVECPESGSGSGSGSGGGGGGGSGETSGGGTGGSWGGGSWGGGSPDGSGDGGLYGGGGGGSSSGSGSGTSGSGETGGTNTGTELFTNFDENPMITYPVLPDPIKIAKHLEQLNEITNDSNKPYKANVDILKQSLNDLLEKGFEFRTNDDGSLQSAILLPSTPTGVYFGIPQINSLVRMHSHPNTLDPIFSGEDIAGMAEFFAVKNDLGAEDSEEVTALLISRSGAFALKVDDPDKVDSFQDDLKTGMDNQYKPTIENFIESYDAEVVNEAQKLCNGSCSDEEYNSYLEAKFIIWLKSWDTGFGYYKGTVNTDGTYTWERIN